MLLLFLFSSGLSLGQPKELTLNDAINIAIRNNKQLHAFNLKVKEQKALKPTAFSVEKTKIFYEYDENNIAANDHSLNIIGIEQDFSFPTVYSAQNKINKQSISIAQTQLINQRQELIKKVSQTYYHLQYLLNKQSIFIEMDSLHRKFVKNANNSYKHGDYSQLNLMNAQAKQQKVSLTLNSIKHDLNITHQQLQTLIQHDSSYVITVIKPQLIQIKEVDISNNSGIMLMQQQTEYQNRLLKLERNKLAPDITLNYFIGTNSYSNAENYNGFLVELGIPLFFGEQKARIKANKIALNVSREMQDNYFLEVKAEYSRLKSELAKHKEAIDYYESIGNDLSSRIITSARKSYNLGEIDFCTFAMNIENALNITVSYLENIAEYNKIALEINLQPLISEN